MTDIKVGDKVTYRPKPDKPGFMPLGLAGCDVEAITEDGYAKLNWRWGNIAENFYAPLDCVTKNEPYTTFVNDEGLLESRET